MKYILQLQRELVSGSYQPKPYRHKEIYEPKKRSILAPAFIDRIVQHSIHRELSPFYERFFIPNSFACREGKGIHKAMIAVKKYVKSDPKLYVCQLDISKYYPSVNHNKLYSLLEKRVEDQQLLNLLKVIIDSSDSGTEFDDLFPPDSPFHTNGRRGIPIGNLTSQLFANVYLHEADMYAKQKLKIRYYVRYMDDILFFHRDKEQLSIWKQQMETFLHDELYLTMNPKKVRIYPVRQGVRFVGYVITPQTIRVKKGTVKHFKKRFKKQLVLVRAGKYPVDKLIASLDAWKAHISHGNGLPLSTELEGQLYSPLEDGSAEHD